MNTGKIWQTTWLAATVSMIALATAVAQTPAPATTAASVPAAAEAPPPGLWINGIHFSAQIEGGITFAPAAPKLNNGQLFTDHPNQLMLNQILLTANKPLDPKATDFDWGFKLQGMYGSDARYTQFLGELNRVNPYARNQFDIVEANVLLHVPFVTAGGMDIKAGQYTTPLGYETIDPSTNLFYSHSYIFNFGLPFKHTGALTISHLTPMVDLYLGLDTGVNTTFGPLGENNSAIAFLGGVNLTLMDGALTVLALTHIGPENATRALSPAGFNADGYMRYLNDIVVTYKASDKLTLVTEANLIRDDFAGFVTSGRPSAANAFGVAQYASYVFSDTLTLNGRAEFYRDDNNFFVASFARNNGFVKTEQGFGGFAQTLSPFASTYGELTLGVTYKPANMPPVISGLLIRPEIRWDHAFTNTRPYNSNQANNAVTIASDVVLTF